MRFSLIRLELVATTVLLGTALGWAHLRGLELAGPGGTTAGAAALGAAAGLALAATLPLITSSWATRVLLLRGLRRSWDALESALAPGLGYRDIVVLAICSAVSEEALFRGVLQSEIGLLPASAIFGLLHPLGAAYVLWAALAGTGLGLLYVASGSLIAPIAAHGVYNLVALTYLRRRFARPAGPR
jgi:membrane protease YdiL (CAAX protease family)